MQAAGVGKSGPDDYKTARQECMADYLKISHGRLVRTAAEGEVGIPACSGEKRPPLYNPGQVRSSLDMLHMYIE